MRRILFLIHKQSEESGFDSVGFSSEVPPARRAVSMNTAAPRRCNFGRASLSNFRFFRLFVYIFIPLFSMLHANTVFYLTGMDEHLLTYRGIVANQDDWTEPYKELKKVFEKRGYLFFPCSFEYLVDHHSQAQWIIKHNVPTKSQLALLPTEALEKMIILVTEPPHTFVANYDESIVSHMNTILTWDDTLIDHQKYFKYHFVQSKLKMLEEIPPFHERKLCTLIASNKEVPHPNELYSKRKEAITFFSETAPENFDFYGLGWNLSHYQTYKGAPQSKTDTLKNYKFSICYENICKTAGYISEKIFGCFVAGCVPIYWGADNISEYIPENCFIDKRKFSTLNDLYMHLISITEEEHAKYLDNIKQFLASNQAYYFSTDHFVKTLLQITQEER